jgi:hypothetical protein
VNLELSHQRARLAYAKSAIDGLRRVPNSADAIRVAADALAKIAAIKGQDCDDF